MHGDAMNAVANLRRRVRDVDRVQATIDRLPCFAAVICTKRPGRRNGCEDSLGVVRIQQNRMQAHAAGTGCPGSSRTMAAQSRYFLPGLRAVGRAEQGGVLNSSVNRVRIVERRFEMPYPFEFPGPWRAVIELVRGERLAGLWRRIIDKLVALALEHALRSSGRFARRRSRLVPSLSIVIRALNDLAEPAARLRCIDSIRVGGRSLQVINLPARKKRRANVPPFPFSV